MDLDDRREGAPFLFDFQLASQPWAAARSCNATLGVIGASEHRDYERLIPQLVSCYFAPSDQPTQTLATSETAAANSIPRLKQAYFERSQLGKFDGVRDTRALPSSAGSAR